MAIDLHLLRITTEELIEDAERMKDTHLADLFAAVFGTWSFVISLAFVLYTGDMTGIVTGVLPSQFIALSSGVNVYRDRTGREGWEGMNLVSVLAAIWMLLATLFLPGHQIMQFSNVFAAMWIGLASTYASFLRQNDVHRETNIQLKHLF